MNVLAIDVGSSSVKAGMLRGRRIVGDVARRDYRTRTDGPRVEVDADDVMRAVAGAVRSLGRAARAADVIALDAMAPSWVAMDRNGRALTPVVTHQDRRSVDEAREIERVVGKDRHLKIVGNRPFPGGISSTTALWFSRHAPAVMKRADLIGHLTTFLHRQLTNARVTDPSNASFMGLYDTVGMSGWVAEMLDVVRISQKQLPEIVDASEMAGTLSGEAASRLGLRVGTPVLAGIMDGSGALLAAGLREGQVIDVMGSTDVLAICTARPKPDERVLTRPVGTGRWWVQVMNIASAATTFKWLHSTLFAELSEEKFRSILRRTHARDTRGVTFDLGLAGDRHSIDPVTAGFRGLTLSTSREDLLASAVDALAHASAARWEVLKSLGLRRRGSILLTGGLSGAMRHVLHRDWPKGLRFRQIDEATLKGLATLVG